MPSPKPTPEPQTPNFGETPTAPVFQVNDDDIASLIYTVQGIAEGQNPGVFGAGIGGVDFEKAKTLIKTLTPFLLAILKTAYPNIPIDVIVDLLTKKVDSVNLAS